MHRGTAKEITEGLTDHAHQRASTGRRTIGQRFTTHTSESPQGNAERLGSLGQALAEALADNGSETA